MGNLIRLKLLFDLLFFLALVCLSKQEDDGFVPNVFQFFHEKVNNRLMEHITMRHHVELAYRSYGAYFDRADVELPGFKKFFRQLGKESYDRAVSFTSYINSRGGRLKFPMLQLNETCNYIYPSSENRQTKVKTKTCICNFQFHDSTVKVDDVFCEPEWKKQPGLYAAREALMLERSVNEDLAKLADLTISLHDAHAKVIIEHVMGHQIDTIKRLADLVDDLEKYELDNDYPLGEYLVDKELEK